MADQFMQRLASLGSFYSDCTIGVEGGKNIAAHRLVLHGYSPVLGEFLEKTPPSEEDGTVYLDLKADDPDAVRAMLDSFYKGTYSEPLSMSTSPMAFHITVFDLAIKYQIPALRDIAITFFRDVLDSGSCSTKDLLEAAGKLENVSSPNLAIVDTLRSDIINAFSERSHSILDDPAFRTFIQAHPQWVIRLLKASNAESTSRQQHGSTGNNEVLDLQGMEAIRGGFPAISDMGR